MKDNLIIVLLPLVLFLLVIPMGEIEGQSTLSLNTDSKIYQRGDLITISGNVDQIENDQITIKITNPKNQIVIIGQSSISSINTFMFLIPADGPLWTITGKYKVSASYNDVEISTSFLFIDPENKLKKLDPIKEEAKQEIIEIISQVKSYPKIYSYGIYQYFETVNYASSFLVLNDDSSEIRIGRIVIKIQEGDNQYKVIYSFLVKDWKFEFSKDKTTFSGEGPIKQHGTNLIEHMTIQGKNNVLDMQPDNIYSIRSKIGPEGEHLFVYRIFMVGYLK